MITEDYVSFEVAKLLKEKGFDWDWSPFYSEQDRDEWARNNNYNIPNPNYDANIPFDSEILNVIAPHVSLQMAMKWLRDICNIHIMIDCTGSNNWEPTIQKYDGTDFIVEGYVYKSLRNGKFISLGFKSYEEACEAGIKYCLEKLI